MSKPAGPNEGERNLTLKLDLAKKNLAVLEYSASSERTILEKRAEELAKCFGEEVHGASQEVIFFELANEMFAVEKEYAKEVLPLKDITPLPCVPAFVLGIINVRGKILSVLDLKIFFEMPAAGITELNRVIILKDDQMEFGILADRIIGADKIYSANLQKTLPTLNGIREEYLRGITNERAVLLDGGKLMNATKIIINEQV